jgi:hypothetical protein
MWSRYADPSRWREWAPQIRAVEAQGPLRVGLSGDVVGVAGLRAAFLVTSVDAEAGRWSWRVRGGVGPVRTTLEIDHEVADGWAALRVTGPAAAVVAYEPVARLALARLVRA